MFQGCHSYWILPLQTIWRPITWEGSESVFEDGHENNTITENEGDADNFDVGYEVQPNPTPSSSKKRKVLGKGEKIWATEKLQRSLDRILDGFGPSQQGLPEDNISYGKCFKMLDEIPSLVKGSYESGNTSEINIEV